MRVVCISDTHNKHSDLVLPEGDILIHCGDYCHFGYEEETDSFDEWLGKQNFAHKFVVKGNHDFDKPLTNAVMLGDLSVIVEGVLFGGLNYLDPEVTYRNFSKLDVLISHEPPLGILDGTGGDLEILEIVSRANPKLHVFGHIHSGYGEVERINTLFVNVSSCDVNYNLKNAPRVFDITKTKEGIKLAPL
jgi:predicted phosphodiesterase